MAAHRVSARVRKLLGFIEANNRARAILRRADGLVDRAGYLRAQVAADDPRLGNLLSSVLDSGRPATTGSIAVERTPKRPRLAVHLSPIDVDGRGSSSVALLRSHSLSIRRARGAFDVDQVAVPLGLTRAGSRVAVALAEGASVRDIATGTGRKESSVRWLIMNIHSKLDISPNADLVQMVLTAVWARVRDPENAHQAACCGVDASR